LGYLSRVVVLLAAVATLAGGCASKDAVYREIAASRSKDYERWLAEGAGRAANEPKISGKLTTEDAVKLALLYNKELQAAVQERSVASGRIKEAAAQAHVFFRRFLPCPDFSQFSRRLASVYSKEINV
jgi:hypothetical protein